jgi:hypothetical protein
VLSRSKALRYEDHGMSWQFSSKNGFHSPFTYQGA